MAELLCVRMHVCAGVCQSPGVTIRLCVSGLVVYSGCCRDRIWLNSYVTGP